MKIHSLFTEILFFFIVLLFFIMPPVYNSIGTVIGENTVIRWTFPFLQVFLALFAVFICYIYKDKRNKKINIFGFRILFTIGLLFTSSLLLNFLAALMPSDGLIQVTAFSLPSNIPEWIFCILNFILSAFYEEVLYRYYFTDTLISILTRINIVFEKKLFYIICELLGCVVFALAHSYSGVFAVINAAIAHFILRYTYKKSNSIIPGVISHFTYNVISLILL